jgi:CBS domain-containing protein
MTIQAVLGRKGGEVISVGSDSSVGEAVALLAERRIGAVPVVDSGRVVGIFSERDVVYGLARNGAAFLEARVSEAMTAPAISVEPSESVLGALSLMTRRRIRHLPVIDGQAVCGFVSIGDLVKHRIEKIEAEAQAMRAYIQSA